MNYLIFAFSLTLLLLPGKPTDCRPPGDPVIPANINTLLSKYTCATCHNMNNRLVGPSWKAIAEKKYSKKRIVDLVYKPSPNNWPTYPPMAAMPNVPKADLTKIAEWLTSVK
jgi:cytochrome c